MRSRQLVIGTISVVAVLLIAGVLIIRASGYRSPTAKSINSQRVVSGSSPTRPDAVLRIGVSAVVSPSDSIESYRRLADYLGSELGMPAEIVVRKSYLEMNQLLAGGRVDVAFICSGAYVEDRAKGYMSLLAAPIVRGQSEYYSDIIVPAGSRVGSLADLKGMRFAYTDELSNTGYSAPQRLLQSRGADPQKYFGETVFTGSHDKSIDAVANGLVDGAAVDHLVLEALAIRGEPAASGVRIVERIGPYGMPPVVVSNSLDTADRETILRALLKADEEPEVLAALRDAGIDSFRVPADSEYDSVLDAQPSSRPVVDDK